MSSPRSVTDAIPLGPVGSITDEEPHPIYGLAAASVGEVCHIIKINDIKPISPSVSHQLMLFKHGKTGAADEPAIHTSVKEDLETPKTAHSTCSIFFPPSHDHARVYQSGHNSTAQTPITSHSTCSVFFPPSTPGVSPTANGNGNGNNRTKVNLFGYKADYPFTLDYTSLKNSNGYDHGMRSAPLYPSTLEKSQLYSRRFIESESKTENYNVETEKGQDIAYFDINNNKRSSHSKASSASTSTSTSAYYEERGDSDTSCSTPSLTNSPTTPSSTSSNIPRIIVTPPQHKLIFVDTPSPSPPTPSPTIITQERSTKRPLTTLCGSYSIYKNSLPFRNTDPSSSLSGKTIKKEITIPVEDDEDDDEVQQYTTGTIVHNHTYTQVQGRNNTDEKLNNSNLSSHKKEYDYFRALKMFYAQGRADSITKKAISWCEQQRNNFYTNRDQQTQQFHPQPQPQPHTMYRQETGRNMMSLIGRRLRGAEKVTVIH